MMTQDDVLLRLTAIFRDVFDDPGLKLTRATTADMIPQWDSMSQITLAVEIEHRFGIKIKAAEMEQMRNIRELMALIEARLPVDAR
jgi:acyl carrier protein